VLVLANCQITRVVVSETPLCRRVRRLECVAVDAAGQGIDHMQDVNLLLGRALFSALESYQQTLQALYIHMRRSFTLTR
jgi:hypothetical protein